MNAFRNLSLSFPFQMNNFMGKSIKADSGDSWDGSVTAGMSRNNDWHICGLPNDLYAVSGYCLGVVV